MSKLIPLRDYDKSDIAVVFIHGFRSNPTKTWMGKNAHKCWTIKLGEETNSHIYHFEYPNKTGAQKSLPYTHAAQSLLDKLDELREKYEGFIAVTHSFGGLVLKQCFRLAYEDGTPRERNLVDSIKGVTMISCPSRGHGFAWASLAFFSPAANFKLMRKHNGEIIELHDSFQQRLNAEVLQRSILTFGEQFRSYLFFRVNPNESRLTVTGSKHRVMPKNHTTICKGLETADDVYRGIKKQTEEVRNIIRQARRFPLTPSGN